MIRLKNIKIHEDLTDEQVLVKALHKNGLKIDEIENWHIYKKSIDARKKADIFYNYSIDIELKNKSRENKFEKVELNKIPQINVKRKSSKNPIIIGAGPAGLFSALTLIDNGIKPIIIERGKK